jgi:hypothetical protein
MSKLLSTLFVFAVAFAGVAVPLGGSGIIPVR